MLEGMQQSLSTVLPATLALVAALHDFATAFQISYPFQQSLYRIGAPFRNFLTLEDVTDPVKTEVRRFKPKVLALSILAFIASAGWLGCFVYGVYLGNVEYAVGCLVTSLSWVRILPCLSLMP